MGLDTTHGCYSGGYAGFNEWRKHLAKAANLPPLEIMDGFWDDRKKQLYEEAKKREGCVYTGRGIFYYLHDFLPIKWDILKPDILHLLLNHSDCDGCIDADICEPLADRLEQLLPYFKHKENFMPKLPKNFKYMSDPNDRFIYKIYEKITIDFIAGLRRAAKRKQKVTFA